MDPELKMLKVWKDCAERRFENAKTRHEIDAACHELVQVNIKIDQLLQERRMPSGTKDIGCNVSIFNRLWGFLCNRNFRVNNKRAERQEVA